MIVEPEGAQRVEVGVAQVLRMVVHQDSEIAQCAFPVGELGHLPVIDGHPLAERPVACDFPQLVGVVGVAVGAAVLPGHHRGDHLAFPSAQPAPPIGAQQRQQVTVEPFEITLVEGQRAKPVGRQSLPRAAAD